MLTMFSGCPFLGVRCEGSLDLFLIARKTRDSWTWVFILSKILLAGPNDLLSSAVDAVLRWACGWMSHLFQVTFVVYFDQLSVAARTQKLV